VVEIPSFSAKAVWRMAPRTRLIRSPAKIFIPENLQNLQKGASGFALIRKPKAGRRQNSAQ
jgi:hypothetical protein